MGWLKNYAGSGSHPASGPSVEESPHRGVFPALEVFESQRDSGISRSILPAAWSSWLRSRRSACMTRGLYRSTPADRMCCRARRGPPGHPDRSAASLPRRPAGRRRGGNTRTEWHGRHWRRSWLARSVHPYRGLAIDGDGLALRRPAVSDDSRHECQRASDAVPLDERESWSPGVGERDRAGRLRRRPVSAETVHCHD